MSPVPSTPVPSTPVPSRVPSTPGVRVAVLTRTPLLAALAALAGLAGVTGCDGGPPAPAASAASPAPAASQASPASSAGAAGGPAPGSPQVAAAVKAFYDGYLADPSAEVNERYLTEGAAAEVFAAGETDDRVLCPGDRPTSLAYGSPTVSGDTATVTVTARGKTSPERRITVTVAMPDILVSAITCQPS